MNEEVKYILIYEYHDTFYDVYNNLELLRLALYNLKENYKNDRDFKYVIYCGKDVTESVNEYEKDL